jgi:hypothetical protein
LTLIAVDLRCELDKCCSADEQGVLAVASRRSAREAGDIDALTTDPPPRCLTWVPGTAATALDRLACVASDWRGMARVVPEDWGNETALLPWLIDDFAAVLAHIRRPLLVELGEESPPWNGVYRLASTFPTLPVILGGASGMQPVIARELCRACPNVLLETSNQEASELALTVDAVGAGRVVFASGRPRRNLKHALLACEQARFDTRERQLMLLVNAERLLVGSWTS